MFGFDPVVLAIIVLAAVSAAAVAYALLFSKIEADKKSASRINRVKSAESDRVKVKAARDRVQELSKRRKSVQDNLKDLEKRQHEKTKKTLSMKSRLVQAGLTITPAKFYLISAIFASVLLFVALVIGVSWMVMVGIAVVAGLGLPRWVLGFLIKRRQTKFLNELPNALDVITRSIKSGLPLNDAIRLIATEGTDPVKSEFRRVIEAQQVGLSIPDACARMTIHMPPRSQLLRHRHRHPVAGRRQSVGSDRQSLQGTARAQEDEGQGRGAVDGSQGIGSHHRRSTLHRRDPRLSHLAELHDDPFHRSARPFHHGFLGDLDVDRHLRHAQHGQF